MIDVGPCSLAGGEPPRSSYQHKNRSDRSAKQFSSDGTRRIIDTNYLLCQYGPKTHTVTIRPRQLQLLFRGAAEAKYAARLPSDTYPTWFRLNGTSCAVARTRLRRASRTKAQVRRAGALIAPAKLKPDHSSLLLIENRTSWLFRTPPMVKTLLRKSPHACRNCDPLDFPPVMALTSM